MADLCRPRWFRHKRQLAAYTLAGALASVAVANDGAVEDEVPNRFAPSKPSKRANTSLPETMPELIPFARMTPMQTESNNNQQYALDLNSLRFAENIVMVTISIRSTRGATTTGYYAFNCAEQRYRLMAYPAGKQWKRSTRRTKWHDVFSVTRRPPQYPAVYTAACLPGGRTAGNRDKFAERLVKWRQLSPG